MALTRRHALLFVVKFVVRRNHCCAKKNKTFLGKGLCFVLHKRIMICVKCAGGYKAYMAYNNSYTHTHARSVDGTIVPYSIYLQCVNINDIEMIMQFNHYSALSLNTEQFLLFLFTPLILLVLSFCIEIYVSLVIHMYHSSQHTLLLFHM